MQLASVSLLGVCMDCQDNTHGHNCEECVPRYYRAPGGDGGGVKDKCVPCPCPSHSSSGTCHLGETCCREFWENSDSKSILKMFQSYQFIDLIQSGWKMWAEPPGSRQVYSKTSLFLHQFVQYLTHTYTRRSDKKMYRGSD